MRDSYIYHRPETNEDEKVEGKTWKWRWQAHYTDGTVFVQCNDEDGSFHQIREIDTQRLHFIRLFNSENNRFFDVVWHPSRKLICGALRNKLENDTVRIDFYYLGYVTQIQGINHNVILVALPDDNIIVVEDLNKITLEL